MGTEADGESKVKQRKGHTISELLIRQYVASVRPGECQRLGTGELAELHDSGPDTRFSIVHDVACERLEHVDGVGIIILVVFACSSKE